MFRFIFAAPDLPRGRFVDGIQKYVPNQKGIYRIKNEIKASYKINFNGWNSAHDYYVTNKDENEYRIAVIGDSYVEALQVDFDKSLAEQLENRLGRDRFKVYRFGLSGAPMSQYLHVMRREVLAYQPDLAVIVLIHNDFRDSYVNNPRPHRSYVYKIRIVDGIVSGEVKPQRPEGKWYNPVIKRSAICRYFACRQKIRLNALKRLFRGAESPKIEYQANIPVNNLSGDKVYNEIATDYIFKRMKELAVSRGIELLVVMDGDRNSIYSGRNTDKLYETGALSLNALAGNIAKKHGIHFIDLHPVFEAEYGENNRKFNFEHDGHWNAYAHEVVANAICKYIRAHLGCNSER